MIPAIIGRFITGLATGFISVGAPNYIGEVATPDIRGFLGAAFQMFGMKNDFFNSQKNLMWIDSDNWPTSRILGWQMARLQGIGPVFSCLEYYWRCCGMAANP